MVSVLDLSVAAVSPNLFVNSPIFALRVPISVSKSFLVASLCAIAWSLDSIRALSSSMHLFAEARF